MKVKQFFICDIGVQLSVHQSVCPSISTINTKVSFSVPLIARTMKPYMVIALDILYKYTPLPCTLDLHFTLH